MNRTHKISSYIHTGHTVGITDKLTLQINISDDGLYRSKLSHYEIHPSYWNASLLAQTPF